MQVSLHTRGQAGTPRGGDVLESGGGVRTGENPAMTFRNRQHWSSKHRSIWAWVQGPHTLLSTIWESWFLPGLPTQKGRPSLRFFYSLPPHKLLQPTLYNSLYLVFKLFIPLPHYRV